MKCFVCNSLLSKHPAKVAKRYNLSMLCCYCITFLLGYDECHDDIATPQRCSECVNTDCSGHKKGQRMVAMGLDKIPAARLLDARENSVRFEDFLRSLIFQILVLMIKVLEKK